MPGGFYWHVQDLDLSEATVSAAVGIKRGLAVEAIVPFRRVVARIRFLDHERAPLLRPQGDIHHRNETLTGFADPWLMLHAGKVAGRWTIAARGGVTVPLGRTEPNPFTLADLGLPHEHIQFGTGTWDPVVGLAAGRRWGQTTLTLTGLARLVLAQNEHGYEAGNRYYADASVSRGAGPWNLSLGLDLLSEEAERWDGRVRTEEGNLGRTDLLVAAGVSRALGGAGSAFVSLKVPVVTHSEGSQVDYPFILSLGFAH